NLLSYKPERYTLNPIETRHQSFQNWFNESRTPKPITHVYEEWVVERIIYATMILHDSVETDPEIRGGVPVIKGTRIPVSQILAEVAEDEKISAIADDFNLDVNTLMKLFEGMAIHLDRPFRK
ncbi:MAG: DUF433 domain-containing protein, partial [Thermoguttaceae bacterium]